MTHPDLADCHESPGVLALNNVCPTCGAQKGQECVTKSGRPIQGHRLWSNDLSSWFRFPGIHQTRMDA